MLAPLALQCKWMVVIHRAASEHPSKSGQMVRFSVYLPATPSIKEGRAVGITGKHQLQSQAPPSSEEGSGSREYFCFLLRDGAGSLTS